MTSTKISSALGLTYGEQGHYSLVTAVGAPETIRHAMIPVKSGGGADDCFGAEAGSRTPVTATGGACMMDVTGSGQMDLVLMQIGRAGNSHSASRWQRAFEELDAEAAGLKVSGHAVACAVGDYDGDGLNDLAVALDGAVLLFRNLGHGQFKNVTAESGLAAAQSARRALRLWIMTTMAIWICC